MKRSTATYCDTYWWTGLVRTLEQLSWRHWTCCDLEDVPPFIRWNVFKITETSPVDLTHFAPTHDDLDEGDPPQTICHVASSRHKSVVLLMHDSSELMRAAPQFELL